MTAQTVLIVDDESVASTMASNIFQAEGYETIIAENGEEMHRIIATNHIDLILLDINLPGKNGLILAREIKEKNPDIAFIFVTGSDNEIDRILGLEIGADDYITKPFNPRELTIRAKNIINRTQKSRIKLEEAIKSVVLEANDTEPKASLF
jgi:two-component system aerobic respiration control protein ArcA